MLGLLIKDQVHLVIPMRWTDVDASSPILDPPSISTRLSPVSLSLVVSAVVFLFEVGGVKQTGLSILDGNTAG